MGIKNLNTLLKEYCNDAFQIRSLSEWQGKRIAIDLCNLIYIYKSPAWSNVVDATDVISEDPDRNEVTRLFVDRFKTFIFRLLKNKITPIIVCDGPAPQEKGEITHLKRQKDKETNREKMEKLREKLRSDDLLQNNLADVEVLRTLMKRLVPVGKEDIETITTLMTGIGIPVLQSSGEAEALCSLLCKTGRVSAVYSTDKDNLVHGCPIMIREFLGRSFNDETREMDDHVSVINFHKVLEQLNLTYPQFVDLCIMSGCDYNTNIPRVGVKISYKLIQQYGSIDNLPGKYDVSCLNHEVCRRLFSRQSFVSLCQNPDISLNVDVNSLSNYAREFLEPYGVDHWISELVDLYRNFPQPSNTLFLSPLTPHPTLNIVDDDNDDMKESDRSIVVLSDKKSTDNDKCIDNILNRLVLE